MDWKSIWEKLEPSVGHWSNELWLSMAITGVIVVLGATGMGIYLAIDIIREKMNKRG